MASLLEKAKEFKGDKRSEISAEHIDLALGFLTGDVTIDQVSFALKGKKGQVAAYVLCARGLREAYFRGKLKIKE